MYIGEDGIQTQSGYGRDNEFWDNILNRVTRIDEYVSGNRFARAPVPVFRTEAEIR
jgi:hypothetical protein